MGPAHWHLVGDTVQDVAPNWAAKTAEEKTLHRAKMLDIIRVRFLREDKPIRSDRLLQSDSSRMHVKSGNAMLRMPVKSS